MAAGSRRSPHGVRQQARPRAGQLRRHARPAPRPAGRGHRPAGAADRGGGRRSGASPTCSPTPRTSTTDGVPHTEEIPDDMEDARAPGARQPGRGHRRRRRRHARALPRRRRPRRRRARAHAARRHRRRHRVPGGHRLGHPRDRHRPPRRLPRRDRPLAPRPPGADRGRQRRRARAHRRDGRRRRRPARLRVQDDRRPLRRAGEPVPGACRAPCGPTTTWSTAAPAATSGSTACSRCGARSRSPPPSWWPATSAAVSKLAGTITGDTLAPRGKPVRMDADRAARAHAGPRGHPAHPGRRGQAGHRPAPPGRRGPGPAHRAQRRDPPDAAAGHGRDPPADHAREAHPQVRGQRRHRADPGPLPRDDHEPVQRASRAGTRSRPAGTASSACA